MVDDRRSRSFKASADAIEQARKTLETTSDLVKKVSKTKPKKVSSQAKATGEVTVDIEKKIRTKLLKRK